MAAGKVDCVADETLICLSEAGEMEGGGGGKVKQPPYSVRREREREGTIRIQDPDGDPKGFSSSPC